MIYLLIAILLLIFSTALLIHIPPVRNMTANLLTEKASEFIEGSLELEGLSWNLPAGKIRLKGLRISSGSESYIEVGEVFVNVSMTELLRGIPAFDEISVNEVNAHLYEDKKGRIVLPVELKEEERAEGEILEEESAGTDETELQMPDVRIKELEITNVRVGFKSEKEDGFSVTGDEISLKTELDLAELRSEGLFKIGYLKLSANKTEEIRNPLNMKWKLPGDGSADVDMTIEMPELDSKVTLTAQDILSGLKYALTLEVKGKLEAITRFINMEERPTGNIDLNAEATGELGSFPDADITLSARDSDIFGNRIDALNVTATSKGGIIEAAVIDADVFQGSVHLEGEGRVYPTLENLRASVMLKNLQTGRIPAVNKARTKIKGELNGSIQVNASELNLKNTKAEVSLTLSPEADSIPSEVVFSPEAEVILAADSGSIAVKKLNISDDGFDVDLAGRYDILKRSYQFNVDLDVSETGKYLRLFNVDGGGALKLEAEGTGSLDNPAGSGSLHIRGLKISGTEIETAAADFDLSAHKLVLSVTEFQGMDLACEAAAIVDDILPVEKYPKTFKASISNLEYRDNNFPDFEGEGRWSEKGITVKISSADEQIKATADMPSEGPVRIRAQMSNFRPDVIGPFMPERFSDLKGSISGEVSAEIPGSGKSPEIKADFSRLKLQAAGVSLHNTEPLKLQMIDNRLQIDSLSLETETQSRLTVEGALNLEEQTFTNLRFTLSEPDLASWKKTAGIETLQGTAEADLTANGSLTLPVIEGSLTISDFHYDMIRLDKLKALFTPGQKESAINSNLSVAGLQLKDQSFPDSAVQISMTESEINLQGNLLGTQINIKPSRILLDEAPGIDAEIDFNELEVGPLAAASASLSSLNGAINGKISLEGPLANIGVWDAAAEFDELTVSAYDMELKTKETVKLNLHENRLNVISFQFDGVAGINISGNIDLFAENGEFASGAAAPDAIPQSKSGLSVRVDGDLHSLLPMIDMLDRLEGELDVRANLSGALNDPRFDGKITLKQAALDGPSLPAPVEDIRSELTFSDEKASITEFKGNFAKGYFEVQGDAGLKNFTPENLDLSLRVRDIDLVYSHELRALFDTDLFMKGAFPELKLSGEVNIAEALYTPEIDFLGILRALTSKSIVTEETGEFGEEPELTVNLDIGIQAPENIRIENPNIELEMGAKLQLVGSADVPGILGRVTLKRGFLDLLRAEFEIVQGLIQFTEPYQMDPDLNITAATFKEGEEITLKITGKASQPNLQLSSSSGKSQSEIMKILVGAPPPSGNQDMTLTEMATEYAVGGAAAAWADYLSEQTDLEIIPFPTTSEGEKFLFSAGKRIGDDFKIVYYKNTESGEGDAVEVELELTPVTELKARQNPDGSISAGIRFNVEFH